ncbi:MAG TPA: hypothetical protein VIH45_01875 [Desulfuromonadaceae bacterium]
MRNTILTLLSIAAIALAGCQNKPAAEAPQKPAAAPAQPGVGDPHAGMKAQEIPAGAGKKGKITQTMNAAGYTYVEAADDKGEKTWLAMPQMKVAVGDKIEYPDTPPMVNFTSKTLNKTFAAIHFIPGIRVEK